MSLQTHALVIGGGLSGLVCAYALRRAGLETHLIEAAPRPGGVIRSERRGGYLLEYGPQSFNATHPIRELCRDLQIDGELLAVPSGAPRFLFRNGELRGVPLSPPAFLNSTLFGFGTKWAFARDILGRSAPPVQEESVAAFVRRKFSPELLENLVGPFVSGIYAGDPEKLGLRSAFPQLYDAEKSAGSVVRGLLRGAKKDPRSKEKPVLATFAQGNQALPDTLAASLGAHLRCNVEARALRHTGATTPQFEVAVNVSGANQLVTADHVILATPAAQASGLLREVHPELSALLASVEYAPVAVVSLGYPRDAVKHGLNGFGFLVPRSAKLRILGSVWNSSLFPGRAPAGHVLLTSFVGGVTDPTAVNLPEPELVDVIHRELTPILSLSRRPSFSSVEIYRSAIPQFSVGHAEKMSQIVTMLSHYPGLHLTGNYLRGPAWSTCIEHALSVAGEVYRP